MTIPDQTSSVSAVRKGRGATYDPHNRFAPTHTVVEDDGWWREETSTTIATEVREEVSKNRRIYRLIAR